MELSTSIPMPMATPPMEIIFILMPVTYIRPKVAMMEVGMETAIMPEVTTFFRNKSSTKKAMMAAKNAVFVMLDRDISIYSAVSVSITRSSSGKSPWISFISLRRASLTCTRFAVDCLSTEIRMPFSPLI